MSAGAINNKCNYDNITFIVILIIIIINIEDIKNLKYLGKPIQDYLFYNRMI